MQQIAWRTKSFFFFFLSEYLLSSADDVPWASVTNNCWSKSTASQRHEARTGPVGECHSVVQHLHSKFKFRALADNRG